VRQWALASFLDGRMPQRLCVSGYELFPLPEEVTRKHPPANQDRAELNGIHCE
jgi:hypothetical protein